MINFYSNKSKAMISSFRHIPVMRTLMLFAYFCFPLHLVGQTTDFETFSPGTVNYQGTGSTTVTGMGYTIPDSYGSLWTVADEWGMATTPFDEEVQDDGTGNMVWRYSNAVIIGTFPSLSAIDT